MKQIIHATTIPPPPLLTYICLNPRGKSRRGTQTDATIAYFAADTHIRPSKEIIYETPKRDSVREYNDNDDNDHYDDEFLEEDAKTFGRENLGPVASPYLMPYVYKRRFLDTQ
jgi:hypothetical protein